MKKIFIPILAACILFTPCFTAAADGSETAFGTITVNDTVVYPSEPTVTVNTVEEITGVAVPAPTDTPAVSELEPVTPDTAPVAEAPTVTAPTTPPATDGEQHMELSTLLLRLWEENREIIFSALSAILSMFLLLVTKKKYIPRIYSAIKKQSSDVEAFRVASDKTFADFDAKLQSFSAYDNTAKQMEQVLAECRLDRQVLIKVIEMQAEQLNHIIEISALPQVRKDQLYAGYRAQLLEVERLKRGDGADG